MARTDPILVTKEFISDMDKYRTAPAGVGLIEAASKNIVVFADKMLGIRLYAWQVFFLHKLQNAVENKDSLKEYLAMTSRQIGKSTAISVFALWCCVFNKYPGTLGNNTIVGITSATDVQAKKLLAEMKKFLIFGDQKMASYRDAKGLALFKDKFFSELLSKTDPNNTAVLTFNSYDPSMHGNFLLAGSRTGSTIKSYPPTTSVLGETFTIVMIDEAGLTEKIDDQFYNEYIKPTGTSTNALFIYCSTPWVSSGFFYRLVDPDGVFGDAPVDLSIFTIDAIAIDGEKQYRTVMDRFIAPMQRDGNLDEIQRAYFCRFVKGQKSYFDPDKVRDCFTNTYEMLPSYGGKCDMGIDFGGQVKSKTVITITELDSGGFVRRLYDKVYEVGKDLTLLEDVAALLKKFNVQRIIPDDCPAGMFMINKMRELGWNIHPMSFRSEKVSKYGAFRSALNKGKIKTYIDDELRTEMLALEFSDRVRNSYIEAAPGYNDDRIDSFVLSTYFFVFESSDVKFYSLKSEIRGDVCPRCGSEEALMLEVKGVLNKKCFKCNHVRVVKDVYD